MPKSILCWLALAVAGAVAAESSPLPIPLGDGQAGFILVDGKPLTEQRFDSAYAFSEGLAQAELGVKRGDGVFDHSEARWGFVDRSGKLAIAAEWESSGRFGNGLAPVRRAGRWGYVDTNGKLQIETRYLRAEAFSEGLAAVELGSGLWNYIDVAGQPVFVPLGADMSDPRALKEGRIVLDLGRASRVVDGSGNTVFEQLGFIRDFSEGLAAYRQDSGWGLVDRQGKVVLPAQLPFIWSPKEGMVLAQHEGKTGYLNTRGEWVIEARFARGNNFSEGLAFVCEAELFGYIDKRGEWRIKPQFQDPMDSASAFHNGRARVKLADGRAAWIDASGTIIWSQAPRAQ